MERDKQVFSGKFSHSGTMKILFYNRNYFVPCRLKNCMRRLLYCNGIACNWLVEEQGQDGQRQKRMGY